MEERLSALLDLGQLQTQVGHLFIRAEATKLNNDYEAASAAYQEYVQRSRAYLNAATDFNARFP